MTTLALRLPSFFRRGLGLVFEPDLAAVDVIEAPRHLAHHLDVRHLVLADRHIFSRGR